MLNHLNPSLWRGQALWGLVLALVILLGGCGPSEPKDRIGGVAKAGTPIGHWVSEGPKPIEVVFHDSKELTWMEQTEEAGSWEQTSEGNLKLVRLNGETTATYAIEGDQMTLTLEGREPLVLKRQ